jgi:hypothetical protein
MAGNVFPKRENRDPEYMGIFLKDHKMNTVRSATLRTSFRQHFTGDFFRTVTVNDHVEIFYRV